MALLGPANRVLARTGARRNPSAATRWEDAFGEIYRRFFPRVHNYVCYRVSSEAVAQDLTASVFEKALRKASSLRSRDAIGPWLFRIAHNTIADHYRRARREDCLSLETLPGTLLAAPDAQSPESQAIRQETFARLQRHIRSLSDREQAIVALKFAGGLANRDIARIVGITPGNVGTVLYRALGKLRQCMIDEEIKDG